MWTCPNTSVVFSPNFVWSLSDFPATKPIWPRSNCLKVWRRTKRKSCVRVLKWVAKFRWKTASIASIFLKAKKTTFTRKQTFSIHHISLFESLGKSIHVRNSGSIARSSSECYFSGVLFLFLSVRRHFFDGFVGRMLCHHSFIFKGQSRGCC